MYSRRRLLAWMLVSMIGIGSIAPGWTQTDYTDGKVLVDELIKRFEGVKDYTLVFYVKQGDKNEWVLDYRCVRPNNIRTEILEGKRRRHVVAYLPEERSKMVKVKSGGAKVWRSIDKINIANTPLVHSLLDTMIADLKEFQSFELKGKSDVAIELGRTIEVKADPSDTTLGDRDDPKEKDPEPEGPPRFAKATVKKNCYIVVATKGDIKQELAVDASTLDLVAVKRWKGNKLELQAEIWETQTNTNPKIEL